MVADNKRPAFVSLVKTRPYRDMNKTHLSPTLRPSPLGVGFWGRALEVSALVGDPRFFHTRGFFGEARAVRPAWAQTENPGCTYTAHTRGYADLNFELPFSKGGFAIFRPFALHR